MFSRAFRFLGALGLAGAAALASDWRAASPDHPWDFPREHWSHRGFRVEWWYFTGHLETQDAPRQRFGFQFTVFRVGILPQRPPLDSPWAAENLLLGHAALSHLDRGEHRFSEVLYRAMPLLAGFSAYPEPRIAWSRGPAGTDQEWSLYFQDDAFRFRAEDAVRSIGFDLTARPVKPFVLQAPHGYSVKGKEPGAASLYYSFTRMNAGGTLSWDGERYPVTGVAWMDREWSSSQLGEDQAGWDWFSIQLDDGREIMLYIMRRRDGAVDVRHATLVEENGVASYLSPEEWSVRSTGAWTSPKTGIRYPARWSLSIPAESLELAIVPEIRDQENRSELPMGVHYWEGAVRVEGPDGARRGRGYVELTGYGENNRPPV
jgi:predicted secreted hydrolase